MTVVDRFPATRGGRLPLGPSSAPSTQHSALPETLGQVLQTFLRDADVSQTEMARWFGWSESTLRRYLEDRQSPSVLRLYFAIHSRHVPLELRVRIVAWYGGSTLVVRPADDDAPPEPAFHLTDQASELRRLMREAQQGGLRLQERLDDLADDPRPSAEKLVNVQESGETLTQAVRRLLRMTTSVFRRRTGQR